MRSGSAVQARPKHMPDMEKRGGERERERGMPCLMHVLVHTCVVWGKVCVGRAYGKVRFSGNKVVKWWYASGGGRKYPMPSQNKEYMMLSVVYKTNNESHAYVMKHSTEICFVCAMPVPPKRCTV